MRPVRVFVTVTVESGSRAPDLSRTTPTMLPVSNWAIAGSATAQSRTATTPTCHLFQFNMTFPLDVDLHGQASRLGGASRSFFLARRRELRLVKFVARVVSAL